MAVNSIFQIRDLLSVLIIHGLGHDGHGRCFENLMPQTLTINTTQQSTLLSVRKKTNQQQLNQRHYNKNIKQ